MIIKDTQRNIEKIYQLKRNYDDSIFIAKLEPHIEGAVIKSKKQLSIEFADKLFKNFIVEKTGFTDDEYHKMLFPLKKISNFDFMENQYLKNISLNDITIGNIRLEKKNYKENEFVILDEPKQDATLMRRYQVGMFDHIAYTYVLKNDDIILSQIDPQEMNIVKNAIKKANGNVLVLGGGLGYYSYMVSQKNNVDSITIVESNKVIKDILELFILPQFHYKKISVIYEDIDIFMNTHTNEHYDTIFIDIGSQNGYEEYKRFIKFEEKYPDSHFDYRLEDSILDNIIINIYQYFGAKLGTDEYQKFFSVVAPELWMYLENIPDVINRPEQIDYYLTRKFAKETAKKI